jgi:mRNA interferase RelE/StbE
VAKAGATYTVWIEPAAERDLKRIEKSNHDAWLVLDRSILELADDPRPPGIKHLGGITYRKREGDFRIIYEIDDAKKEVNVGKVGDRKDVYQ